MERLHHVHVINNGDVIGGRYKIKVRLREGSTGVVYLATDLEDGAEVALKVVDQSLAASSRVRAQLTRLYGRLMNLECDHLVEILDVGDTSGPVFYYTMELLNGISLKNHLRLHGRIRPATVVYITAQILEALGHGHGLGLTHGDLNPACIYLQRTAGDDHQVKVLGFARPNVAQAQRTTGTNCLAPANLPYLAPEQLRRAMVTLRTDIYAVGHVMYEMLAGRSPYDGMPPHVIANRKLKNPRLPFNDAVLGSIVGLTLMGAIHNDPEQRYEDAKAMAAALGELSMKLPRRSRRVCSSGDGRWASAASGAPTDELPALVLEPKSVG